MGTSFQGDPEDDSALSQGANQSYRKSLLAGDPKLSRKNMIPVQRKGTLKNSLIHKFRQGTLGL